jgi:hypothetical protein
VDFKRSSRRFASPEHRWGKASSTEAGQKNKGAKKRPRIPENTEFSDTWNYFFAFLAGFFAAFLAVFFAAFFVAIARSPPLGRTD